MSELSRLSQDLRQALGERLELPAIPGELARQIALLKSGLGDAGGKPPRDRMREAVAEFWRSGTCANVSMARLSCFGVIERFWPDRPALIEDSEAFLKLLRAVDGFSTEPRSFRRCYRGLLHCYFTFDPKFEAASPTVVANCRRLREFLDARIEAIAVKGYEPEWATTLREHRNLLTTEPVRRYAAAALKGDMEEFSQVRRAVEIADTSWVVRELLLAQVQWATEQHDERFKGYIEPLLAVLEQYVIVKTEGLAALVDRYAKAQEREEHPGLREAAIGAWGNPLLELNRPKWARVTDAARRMIAGWTTRILIRQFFEILANDRHTDRRRLQFWERYHEYMDSVYYALGPTASWSPSPDIRRLRELMGSNQLGLSQGGNAANNAFIMVMGRHVVVEFGLTGNACFVFRKDSLPFPLRGEVSGDSSGLKHHSRIHRLLHVNTAQGAWEHEFERVLGELGIRPEAEAPEQRGRQPLNTASSDQRTGQGPTFSRQSLQALARQRGLAIEDLTPNGGRVWVFGAPAWGPIAHRLSHWGFKWLERKGAWYREGWN